MDEQKNLKPNDERDAEATNDETLKDLEANESDAVLNVETDDADMTDSAPARNADGGGSVEVAGDAEREREDVESPM